MEAAAPSPVDIAACNASPGASDGSLVVQIAPIAIPELRPGLNGIQGVRKHSDGRNRHHLHLRSERECSQQGVDEPIHRSKSEPLAHTLIGWRPSSTQLHRRVATEGRAGKSPSSTIAPSRTGQIPPSRRIRASPAKRPMMASSLSLGFPPMLREQGFDTIHLPSVTLGRKVRARHRRGAAQSCPAAGAAHA